jgi:hypothetical protein
MAKNVHVVFGRSTSLSLIASFSIAEHLRGEVITLGDDLRIGPINGLETAEGLLNRRRWFESLGDEVLIQEFNDYGSSDHNIIEAIRQLLVEGQVIHLWFGNNAFDLLSIGRLFDVIKGYAKQIILVPVSDSLQLSLKNYEFVPDSLVVLRVDQIPLLVKHFRSVMQEDLDTFNTIWSEAILRAENLREVSLKGAFQDNVEETINFTLLSFCTKDFQKSARVIGHTLIELKFSISDATLNWMLKKLVVEEQLEARGTLRMMRDYEVRLLV